MGAGRNWHYNPRTGKWTRPKHWLERSRRGRKKSGCYVATAVYGSYDCPEVWTLRRYRDNYLAKRFWGKLFIKAYYSVSPTFVRLFGKTELFNKLFRNRLDKMVIRLNALGYSSDRYEDIEQ